GPRPRCARASPPERWLARLVHRLHDRLGPLPGPPARPAPGPDRNRAPPPRRSPRPLRGIPSASSEPPKLWPSVATTALDRQLSGVSLPESATPIATLPMDRGRARECVGERLRT